MPELLLEDISEERQTELLEKLSRRLVKMKLGIPAIFLLELHKPLNFIGSQIMIILEPFVQAIFNFSDYRTFALMMEKRENVERLIQAIEQIESER